MGEAVKVQWGGDGGYFKWGGHVGPLRHLTIHPNEERASKPVSQEHSRDTGMCEVNTAGAQ